MATSEMLDNREIAAFVWLGAAALWVLSQQKLRESIAGVFKAFFQAVIVIPLLAMLAWIGFELWAGARLALWNATLAKSTLLWTVGSAGVLFFNCTQAASDPRFFRRTIVGTIGVAVFIEFFMNSYVMSLPAEFVLQFVIIVLSLVAAVGGVKPEHKAAKMLCEVLLAAIGFALFIYTVRQVYLGWNRIDGQALLLEFALPIWLTAGLLPFLYILSFYVVYDAAFRGINWATTDGRSRWRSRLALLSALHLRTGAVQKFTWNWAKRLSEAGSLSAARGVVEAFLEELRCARQAELDEQERIRRFTGSQETDEEGRRLDRREFAATIDALRWLETCQMGWYRSRGGRYRDDLLKMIRDDFARQGLPKKSGITFRVSADGQAWYAWRRTATGWCFAIGAAGPPPDQWEYDGPEPPQGFPDQDPAWGDKPFSDQVNRNWR
jgi:hypothetical protein